MRRKRVVDDAVADCLSRHVTDWGKLKNMIRDSLSDFMWKTYEAESDDSADHYGG